MPTKSSTGMLIDVSALPVKMYIDRHVRWTFREVERYLAIPPGVSVTGLGRRLVIVERGARVARGDSWKLVEVSNA